jgi:release factor glutamine methyltransferase
MNISTALSSAAEVLKEAGIAEFRKEAASLMAFILDKDAAFVVAHSEDELLANQKILFDSCIRRRAKREPFQHITGRQEFYGLDFEVSPDVLIPRPETEILVETAIEILSEREKPHFFEIGSGSGCITISILHNVENAQAVAADISDNALAVAATNAEKHNVASRLALRQADVFAGINGEFDLIVSNPPYVPDGQLESLQAEVRMFEPRVALSGGDDGLLIIKRIIDGAPAFLGANGYLLMEIGFDQAGRVRELFDPSVWLNVEFLPDLQGIPRITKARSRN